MGWMLKTWQKKVVSKVFYDWQPSNKKKGTWDPTDVPYLLVPSRTLSFKMMVMVLLDEWTGDSSKVAKGMLWRQSNSNTWNPGKNNTWVEREAKRINAEPLGMGMDKQSFTYQLNFY
jgi:hypothetical protein